MAGARGLMEEIAAKGAQLVVEQLHHMEVIEHVDRLGEVVTHGPNVGLGHVGRDSPHLGPRTTQPLPKWLQGLGSLAVAHEHDGAGDEVQHHREIVMPLADRDLVDGDLLELGELRLAESPLEGLCLDLLDGVPTDLQMLGDILDGHVPRQLQGIALERPRVPLHGIGEPDFHLPGQTALSAINPRHIEANHDGLTADRHGPKLAFDVAMHPELIALASGTAKPFPRLLDAQDDSPAVELRVNVPVAADAKGVIE